MVAPILLASYSMYYTEVQLQAKVVSWLFCLSCLLVSMRRGLTTTNIVLGLKA